MPFSDILLALLTVVIWGGNVVAIKVGVNELPALVILTLRFALTALIFLPFIKWPERRKLFLLFEISFYMCVLHQGLLFVALKMMGASTMVILLQSQILFATLMGWLILKETIHWRTATGLSVGFLGLLLTFGAPDLQQNPWGFGVTMLSTLALAFSYIRMRQLKDVHPMTLIGVTNGFAVPFILLGSVLFTAGGWGHLHDADWTKVTIVLSYQVVLVSLSHILWQALLSRNPVATVASFVLLMPVVAILLSGLILGETLTPPLIWGGTLTIIGVAIITLRRIQKHMPLPADPMV